MGLAGTTRSAERDRGDPLYPLDSERGEQEESLHGSGGWASE